LGARRGGPDARPDPRPRLAASRRTVRLATLVGVATASSHLLEIIREPAQLVADVRRAVGQFPQYASRLTEQCVVVIEHTG